MATALPARLAAGIALSAVLFTACGDVTINGAYPNMDFTDYWWWSDNTVYVAKRTVSINEPVGGRLRMRLEAFNGKVSIIGLPDTGSVTLTAELLVGSESLEDAQENLDNLEVLLTNGSDEIRVQTVQPAFTNGRQYAVDYTVGVPEGLEVFVTQTNGHITLENLDNLLNVQAMNGTVMLLGIRGDTSAGVYNGDIDGTVIPPPGGEIMLSTVNGDIDLRIPTSTSAAIHAFAGNGTITWDNLTWAEISQNARSLTGTLGSGAGVISLETVNGNTSVTGF